MEKSLLETAEKSKARKKGNHSKKLGAQTTMKSREWTDMPLRQWKEKIPRDQQGLCHLLHDWQQARTCLQGHSGQRKCGGFISSLFLFLFYFFKKICIVIPNPKITRDLTGLLWVFSLFRFFFFSSFYFENLGELTISKISKQLAERSANLGFWHDDEMDVSRTTTDFAFLDF